VTEAEEHTRIFRAEEAATKVRIPLPHSQSQTLPHVRTVVRREALLPSAVVRVTCAVDFTSNSP
jgi:hypothetical protein